jgi:hypothetical protein
VRCNIAKQIVFDIIPLMDNGFYLNGVKLRTKFARHACNVVRRTVYSSGEAGYAASALPGRFLPNDLAAPSGAAFFYVGFVCDAFYGVARPDRWASHRALA